MSPEEALVPLLRAGRLARHRLLDVACPNDHRRLQVVGTPEGAVVIYTPALGQPVRLGATQGLVDVQWLTADGSYDTRCRCGRRTITAAELFAELDIGEHRRILR